MAAIPKMMRSAVVQAPGGPEVFSITSRAVPVASKGQVLIRVHAFGLNRAEMFTRQGHSPDVTFPRILGIEAAGTVASAPGGEFREGAKVVTVMGGMGRTIDGSYAQYTCVAARNVQEVKEDLPWDVLGSLPEMMHTAWGSLFSSLQLRKGDRLLIRGGSSSVGLAAAAIAKYHGAFVVSTTRNKERESLLRSSGAEDVIIETGSIAAELRKRYPEGVDKVLELVGVVTLADSLQATKQGGIVCTAGIVGGKWVIEDFQPNMTIPSGVMLTTFSSLAQHFSTTPFDTVVKLVKNGSLKVPIKTYTLDQISEVHRAMEENTAAAKMVVLVD